ncbi:copper transport outer membrane protein MctB [Melghirimyces profundicolus]|uniref:Copper transport outer membrane protein MctB n=1 Tax=Melghirimyces profundicolus TaxID=1242148 RepID=A0A2T6B831_9BACL|nr:copper transporter [Melghirimyces profundicolus]PTX52188.1 copper transport outer membrane protein MctB [Melghirimyces profundicolus]
MISTRMFLIWISAVFLSLGIGILLGGIGGQPWLKQMERDLVGRLEARIDQASTESGQLRKTLQQQERRMQRLKKQNESLFHEAVRGRLKGRHVLVFGGSEREAEELEQAIRMADGTADRPTRFPALPNRYDAIILLNDPLLKNPRLKGMAKEIRMSYTGPLILKRTRSDQPVFAEAGRRLYFFRGPFMGEPVQTSQLIDLIENVTNPGSEAAS